MKITSALIAIVVGLVLVSPLGADTIHQTDRCHTDGEHFLNRVSSGSSSPPCR
jgi:hypothetical protein